MFFNNGLEAERIRCQLERWNHYRTSDDRELAGLDDHSRLLFPRQLLYQAVVIGLLGDLHETLVDLRLRAKLVLVPTVGESATVADKNERRRLAGGELAGRIDTQRSANGQHHAVRDLGREGQR